MRRALVVMAAGALFAVALGWLVTMLVSRWFGAPDPGPAMAGSAQSAATTADAAVRKIRASLFYVSEDGTRLVAVPSEVPYAEGTVDQARRLVEEQLKPAPPPYAQALPEGTTVRAVFLTERDEAFVDLSGDVTTKHTGGSLDELLSIYAIVNALTVNLPAISRVQILVDGHEVDSLAGHVDLRRPLPQNLTWVTRPDAPAPASPPAPSVSPQAHAPAESPGLASPGGAL
jgi:hypothetical protein